MYVRISVCCGARNLMPFQCWNWWRCWCRSRTRTDRNVWRHSGKRRPSLSTSSARCSLACSRGVVRVWRAETPMTMLSSSFRLSLFDVCLSVGWFFQSGLRNRNHYKSSWKRTHTHTHTLKCCRRKDCCSKTFSSDAWRTATWELRQCIPVESSRSERRQSEKLGHRQWSV